jgi:hypothetical protein
MGAGHDHDHSHHAHDHAHPHTHSPGMAAADAEQVVCCSHHEIEIERYITLCLVGGVLVLVDDDHEALWLHESTIAQLPAMVGAVVLGLPALHRRVA